MSRSNDGCHKNQHFSTRWKSNSERTGYYHTNSKRHSTTNNDHPPAKRPYLCPVSYRSLTELTEKSSEDVITRMLEPNFRLDDFLKDKRIQEKFDWICLMTTLLEKITYCNESRERIVEVLEKILDTCYIKGVHEEIRKFDPETKQLRFKFIQSFLQICKTFLEMIPHSFDGLSTIFERILYIINENPSELIEYEEAKAKLNDVHDRVKQFKKQNESSTTNKPTHSAESSNHFRQLPIIPNVQDLIYDERPILHSNIIDGKYDTVEQYLNIHFRLLREDFVKPLRLGIRQYLTKSEHKNVNIRVYKNVRFHGSRITGSNGLVYDFLLDKTTTSRIHWTNSKRLIYGSLLLISSNNFHSCTFFTVEDRSKLERHSIISVKLLNEITELTSLSSSNLTIIETTIYFEAYRHVLNALQTIPSNDQFPFADFLLKLNTQATPPNYITSTTTYDFTPLLRSHRIDEKYKKVIVLNKEQWPTNEQLHLNPKQYEALMLALTNKVALIQGPPGTGKTYLGVRITAMLLCNKNVWHQPFEQSTPILMICHTNHALDQFLELIVEHLKIKNGIIRVGSRCQNEIIQQFSLLNARKTARERRSLPVELYREKRNLMQEKMQTEATLRDYEAMLKYSNSNILFVSSLHEEYPIITDRQHHFIVERYSSIGARERALFDWLHVKIDDGQIVDDLDEQNQNKSRFDGEEDEEEQRRRNELDYGDDDDEEDFRSRSSTNRYRSTTNKKTYKPKRSEADQRLIESIIKSPTTLNDEIAEQSSPADIWQLSLPNRYNLYRYWLSKYQQYVQDSIQRVTELYQRDVSNLAEIRQEEDYHIIKNSKIVAMTTTCAARYHKLLQKLQSKIVIVEESAAIFEAHIITALNNKCEHLILIGDHVQLKPNPNVYHLATKYYLDISLFERLIKNNLPNVRLNIQHRMRPEIGCLMKHFYNDLENDPIVETDRNRIRGVEKSLFFIDHNHEESTVDDGYSKRNEYEGDYFIELANYLLKQGYNTNQITILVMYLGQKQYIWKKIKDQQSLRGIRIMVTDNYQGEENDIILLSLVRNNVENRIGFLEIENRVCVALSRARCGLFIMGNRQMLETDELWKKILSTLDQTQSIGDGLVLACHQHPNNNIKANSPELFAQRREGGCRELCDTRLICGHQCPLICHSYDKEHENIVCQKKCHQQLECGHSCRYMCHPKKPDNHGECLEQIEKIIPECGHNVHCKCSEIPTMKICKQTTVKQLPCGHSLTISCKTVAFDPELRKIDCPLACNQILACGHQCAGKCGKCHAGRLHVACKQECGRDLICSHVCQTPCASNCPPCLKQCQTRCVHTRCQRKCAELCIPCREPCQYKCKHLKCTRLCSEPCDRDPCNKPCDRPLPCGHDCIGLCGEPCPPKCRYCDKNIVQEIFFGTEDESDARFIFLPDCGHIIEVTGLDRYINDFRANRTSTDGTAIRFPECPRCTQKIYRCTRYTSILNETYELLSRVKKKILGNLSEEEINYKREQLSNDYKQLRADLEEIPFRKLIEDMFSKLDSKTDLFYGDKFLFFENVINYLKEIDQILVDGRKNLPKDVFNILVDDPLLCIVKYFFCQKSDRNLSEQQINDIQSELARVHRVIYIEKFISSLKKELKANEQEAINSMRNLTSRKIGRFTAENRDEFDRLKNEFEYLNNIPGLGINDKERKAIITALNLNKGHWYACPNGHPYIITECGGASQESHCSECGEKIGGQNHHLLDTNRVFSSMDGSTHSAWSNEANLALHRRFQ